MNLFKQTFLIIFGLAFLMTCNMYEPELKTGGISIQFKKQNDANLAKGVQATEALSKVRCVLSRNGRTVHNKVYYKTDASFHIEIHNLEQGENYALILYGSNPLGCAIGRAEKDGIQIIADQVASVELAWEQNLERSTVTDIDGNVYQSVRIGDLWWMTENLKVTHYQNGEPIPNVTGAREWDALDTGAWCAYDNDPTNAETYGLLYNWYAVNDNRNLAPEGWHVPTDEEWKRLEMALGMNPATTDMWGFRGTNEGDKMKAIGNLQDGSGFWAEPNSTANNESCFSALPAGWRIYTGVFYSINTGATFWSSSEHGVLRAWSRSLGNESSYLFRSYGFKGRGFSVRCVKDE